LNVSLRHPVRCDPARRRLWILGQRCHHGALGATLAGIAGAGAMVSRFTPRRTIALAVTGGLLIAHDWDDRGIWFERGSGSQV
jgi:hypothetical protein